VLRDVTTTDVNDSLAPAASVPEAIEASERGPGVSVPPTLVFVAGFALAWWLHDEAPLPLDRDGSRALVIVAWMMLVIGIALFLWALGVFLVARTGVMLQKPATVLMTSGPYAWSRNPQYVAFLAMYAGAALLANTLWPIVLLPSVLILMVGAVIAREERYLRATFGRSYEEYCRRVRRWI
jgi:protein-S-isoprenylcysteine O-methyltransferase Ste14